MPTTRINAKPRRSIPAAGEGGGAGRVRLQRFMADSGVASRRECERLIEHGDVQVNGKTVTDLPVFVDPAADRVVVRGRALKPPPTRAERVYVMLNKPEKVIASTRDQGAVPGDPGADARTTVLDLVQHRTGARLFPVGRLGFHDTGLVLLTNDGDLAHRLTHASFGVTKTYDVVIKGHVGRALFETIRAKLKLRDPEAIRIVKPAESATVLRIVLPEAGISLEDVLLSIGCRVKRMTRVAIGPLELKAVPVGRWRDLTRSEIAALRAAGRRDRATSPAKRPINRSRSTPA